MTLRVLFVLMGAATCFPALFFFSLHRRGDGPKRISRALRALSLIAILTGSRVMSSNLDRLEQPLTFVSAWDQILTIATVVACAVCSCYFFAVYVNERKWWED